jgi:hypothetical protein
MCFLVAVPGNETGLRNRFSPHDDIFGAPRNLVDELIHYGFGGLGQRSLGK